MSGSAQMGLVDLQAHEQVALLGEVEREVLILSAKGYSVKEIARLRNREIKTIEMQRRNIFHKFGVGTLVECAVIAAKARIV